MATQDALRPRYQQVAEALIASIERGDYAVGDSLPTEQELCAEFDVSRHTVREALRLLTTQRYVKRRQGSGSEVISAAPRASYLHTMRSLSELFEYASDTRLDLSFIGITEPDPDTAEILGRAPGRRWLLAEGVRRARSGDAINFTRVYLHEDFASVASQLPDHVGPIYRLLEERFGAKVEEVAQEILAGPFEPSAAEALGVKPGAVAVRILRRYLDAADMPLIVSVNWHPAETFSYAMRLKRDGGGG